MDKNLKWLLLTCGCTIFFLLPVAWFNFYIDPMWTFDHTNPYNTEQMPFDERQQKTNQLTFAPQSYDALLIGSSRCSYINPHGFPNRVYNYAVSNIQLAEYASYLSYAVQQLGAVETVYVGLDFYGTNQQQQPNEITPEEVIQRANETGYRWKLLLSQDTLAYSWKNYQASREKQYPLNFAYNRDNVKRLSHVALEASWQLEQQGKEKYRTDIYTPYTYGNVPELLQNIQKAVPDSRVVAFTTPVQADFFSLLPELGLYDAYEQWLRDCVKCFGCVYHFMYLNDITRDMAHFYDGSHLYPETAQKMVDFMLQCSHDEGEDFGILLTPDNMNQVLQDLRSRTAAEYGIEL